MPRPDRRDEPAVEMRQRLLDIGRELVFEQPVVNGVDLVRVTDVARRAGVTAGAVYHYWESQDDFRDDVLTELLEEDQLPHPDYVTEGRDRVRNAPSPVEATAAVAVTLADAAGRGGLLPLFVGLWAERQEDLASDLKASHDRYDEVFVTVVTELLSAHGLAIRPPLTIEQLTSSLLATCTGFAIRHRGDPGSVRPLIEGGPEGQWDLATATVVAILCASVHRVDTDSASAPRSMVDVARDILDHTA